MDKKKIVSLWSGPRNVSTALMYSFAQRGDTKVLDEPLYAYYLKKTGVVHPGREEVLSAQENNSDIVIENQILNNPTFKDVLFVKNMAHHLIDVNLSFLKSVINIILIRDPEQMLPSLVNQIAKPVLADTGLKQQKELLDHINSIGQKTIVIDSKELLLNPKMMLAKICAYIGIVFVDDMLSWELGAIEEDGVWAKYWYHNIHKSTGFIPFKEKEEDFPNELKPLLKECTPYYNALYKEVVKAKI